MSTLEGTRRLKAALYMGASGGGWGKGGSAGVGWRVRYRCGACGGWEGLASGGGAEGGLYWCGECGGVRCGRRCVTAEVEAQYCGQCLDNVTSYDAALFRHRCKKCFRCPACMAALSFAQHTRAAPAGSATAAPTPTATAQAAQQRVVYLHCSFCRWNSLTEPSALHADSPTALVTSFIKQERADEAQRQVTELIDAFHREHREARLRARAKRHHPQLSAASPAPDQQGRSKASLEPLTVEQLEQARSAQEAKMCLSVKRLQSDVSALELDDPLPTYPLQVSQIATLEQRLNDPNPNVVLASELSAHRWMLGTRVSKRCRPCGKLLIKPDLIGAKTDFKRQHAALFYLPLISIEDVKKESDGWTLRVVFANPPQRSSHLPVSIEASAEPAEVQPGKVVETFLGVADEYDKFWETDVYKDLAEKDKNENAGVVLHRHLNKVALRYRIGPLPSAEQPSHLQMHFRITMGRTPTSEEATVEAMAEVDVSTPSSPSS